MVFLFFFENTAHVLFSSGNMEKIFTDIPLEKKSPLGLPRLDLVRSGVHWRFGLGVRRKGSGAFTGNHPCGAKPASLWTRLEHRPRVHVQNCAKNSAEERLHATASGMSPENEIKNLYEKRITKWCQNGAKLDSKWGCTPTAPHSTPYSTTQHPYSTLESKSGKNRSRKGKRHRSEIN